MKQKIKVNDTITIMRKDTSDRSYQNDLWTVTNFNDTHTMLTSVESRGCFVDDIVIVSAEYHINLVKTPLAHLTDKFVTKPIDWDGCNSDIKACLQADLAVMCEEEDGTTRYITGYSANAGIEWKYVCDDSDQMNFSAKPLLKPVTKTYYKKASEIIAWLEENAEYIAPIWIEKHTGNTWTNEFICKVAGTLYEADSLSIPPEWLESRKITS